MFKRSKGVELKPRRAKKPVTQQAVFVPMMALWGAAVAGAMVYVLPYPLVKRLTPQPIFDVIDPYTHYVAIAGAAVFGAICLYVIARMMKRSAQGAADEDDVVAIDPAEELGSASLDAPLEDDFFDEAEYADDDSYADDDDFESFDELDPEWVEDMREEQFIPAGDPVKAVDALNNHLSSFAKGPQTGSREEGMRIKRAGNGPVFDKPFEDQTHLDLGSFVAEEPAAHAEPSAAPQIETAIEKLRAVAPQDLSLVQMVERLAVALHENKAASLHKTAAQRRDAELAQALKTLAKLTEEGLGTTDATKAEMRQALSKLQSLRGAA